jgi:hypothetical protein
MYRTQTFEEKDHGSGIDSKSSRALVRMSAMERTATGLVRVRVDVDSTDLFDLFFDEAGHLKNQNPLIKGLEAVGGLILQLFQNPTISQVEQAPLKLGEPISGRILLTGLFRGFVRSVPSREPEASWTQTELLESSPVFREIHEHGLLQQVVAG